MNPNYHRRLGLNGIIQQLFFSENALRKTAEYFLKFLFLFESTIPPINNEK